MKRIIEIRVRDEEWVPDRFTQEMTLQQVGQSARRLVEIDEDIYVNMANDALREDYLKSIFGREARKLVAVCKLPLGQLYRAVELPEAT